MNSSEHFIIEEIPCHVLRDTFKAALLTAFSLGTAAVLVIQYYSCSLLNRPYTKQSEHDDVHALAWIALLKYIK